MLDHSSFWITGMFVCLLAASCWPGHGPSRCNGTVELELVLISSREEQLARTRLEKERGFM